MQLTRKSYFSVRLHRSFRGDVIECCSNTMYGPVLNAQRGPLPETIDTTLSCSYSSTHSDGSRSGLPLWGSTRSFKCAHRQEVLTGTVSPIMMDDLTVSTAEKTCLSSPSTLIERDSFGYVELLSYLPCMQDEAVMACSGTVKEQMWQSENQYTQELMRQPEDKNTLALTNYGLLLHTYHKDTLKASGERQTRILRTA